MVGIIAAGAYVPRLRLQKQAIAAAHAWFAPGLKGLAKGERAMANWDEDAITMAVEAARDALAGLDRGRVGRVVLASTSHPNADRQNAGIVKEALNLADEVAAMDVGGSQRAATSALLDALYAARGGAGEALCVASEKRRAQPASELELTTGDAAVALLVGEDAVAAEFLGGHSVSIDFVDHFRGADKAFDYNWEARWVRDEGYAKIAPRAVKGALAKAGVTAGEVDHFIMGAPMKGVNDTVAKASGIVPENVVDPLTGELGEVGTAQPLILLAHALETARAGEILVVAGFGQGCDVLVFRATGQPAVRGLGVSGWLARKKPEANYVKYLTLNGHLNVERGMRAEFDQKTALTALNRSRKAVMALVGGRCTKTGTIQFPKSPISVAQNDRAQNTQEDYPFADRRARIVTHTADSLTYSPDPPCWYGAIEFEEGGRMTVEFADVDPDDVEVGASMRMMFRIKAVDDRRGFTKYFWKAVPDYLAGNPAQLAAE
ncbi:hydroxymethylglutaryl-CoA synthase family protein [Phenylobacterium zucineum]|nr:3-oxoacyl-[acyl-carrier-protein] synthase III C-terminal domain-containing protein [Phenylobacterium zucineum]